MGLRPDEQVAALRRTTKVAPACLAFALLAMPTPRRVSGEPAPRPPTSIEPAVTKQKVLVSHLHRRVRACTAVPAKHPTACARQLGDGEATTALLFEPLATSVGVSRRKRLVVTFPDAPGLHKQTVELALGEWVVNWPGCRAVAHLSITAAKNVSPRVVLRTTSGRCELASSGCRLVEGTAEQRLTIEE